MKKILGNNPETWYAPCQIDQTIHKAGEGEPALARIQADNVIRKAQMAAELIANGFSEDQARRLLHLDGSMALHEPFTDDMEG